MEEVLQRIQEIEQLVSSAEQIDGEERDRRAALRAIESQRKKLIKDLQRLIKNGGSSGDQALDIQIMHGDSITRDKTYNRLDWLAGTITRHPGELVAMRFYSSLDVGRLPENPSIGWQVDKGAHTEKLVEVAVDEHLVVSDYLSELLPQPYEGAIRLGYHRLVNLFGGLPLGDFAKLDLNLHLYVGDQAVQEFMGASRPDESLKIHIASRLLGRPLKVHAELAREIRDRRERFIPSLIEDMAELKRLQDHLINSQHDPVWGLQNPLRHTKGTIQREIVRTKDGVTINFGLSRVIEHARDNLWKMVNNAVVGIEMADNSTLQAAAKMIGYELPIDQQPK